MPLDSEDCEEEGMPPPPDNDSRGPIYTFSSGMTPLSFSSTTAPIAPTQDNSPQPSFTSPFVSDSVTLDESAPSTSVSTASSSRAHGKRRDPSYIPRPPNAFILFRCAFIKEQNIPGKVEGNHSRLSKIIGLCWKQLPPEEKEKWEAKAVIAQAEHRAHYPDWRFRPGANAMAKLKVKEAASSSSKRGPRSKASKEKEEAKQPGSKGGADPKGKGKGKATSHTISLEETRCAKIAGFVAEGIKGEELEEAVKQWEGDHSIPRPSPSKSAATKSKARKSKAAPTHSRTHSTASIALAFPAAPPISEAQEQSSPVSMQDTRTIAIDSSTSHPSPQDSENGVNVAPSGLAGVPLTHMFKRATSAPPPDSRVPLESPGSAPSDVSVDEFPPSSAEPSPVVGNESFKPLVLHAAPTRTHNHTHGRRDTVSFPLSTIPEQMSFASPQQLTWQEAETQRRYEEAQHHDSWGWQQPSSQTGKLDAFGYPDQHSPQQQGPGRLDFSPQQMSYEIPQGGSQFDQGYLDQYGSYYVNDKVEPGQPQWTDMAGSGRQGISVAIEDPYEGDCVPEPGLNVNVPPPTIPAPLAPGNGFHYTQMSPHKSPSYTPSNFSNIQGWGGEYKNPVPESPAWPSSVPQSPLSGAWGYGNAENIAPWGSSEPPPALQRPSVAQDANDWDNHEYRVSSSFNLPVEPMRQVTFHGELLAQQQQAQQRELQRQHMS